MKEIASFFKEEKERFDPCIWEAFKDNHMEFKKIREEIE